jgi:hypothetical protein
VLVRGVRFPPFAKHAMLLDLTRDAQTIEAGEYHFDAQQWVQGTLAGGGRYVVVAEGKKRPHDPVVADSHNEKITPEERERIVRQAEQYQYVPPWAKRIVEQREKEQKKEL